MDFARELNKYSKEALIKGIVENSHFIEDTILSSIKFAEFDILQEKQRAIMEQMRNINLKDLKNLNVYSELDKKYRRYNNQIDKILERKNNRLEN